MVSEGRRGSGSTRPSPGWARSARRRGHHGRRVRAGGPRAPPRAHPRGRAPRARRAQRLRRLEALVALVIQSDRLGASMAKTLRTHADLLRTKRRQRAEEAARKLPIKILLPLALFILPPLLVITVGPAFLKLGDLTINDPDQDKGCDAPRRRQRRHADRFARHIHTHWTRLRGLLGTRRLEPGEGLWNKPIEPGAHVRDALLDRRRLSTTRAA